MQDLQVPQFLSEKKRLALKTKALEALSQSGATGEHITPKNLDILCRDAADVFSPSSSVERALVRNALRESFEGYMNVRLTSEVSEHLATILAGWYPEFKSGLVFKPWAPIDGPCWGLFYVDDIERAISSSRLYHCRLQICSGRASGQAIESSFPGGFIQKALREMGARKYEKYLDEDLGGLTFAAILYHSEARYRLEAIFAPPWAHTSNRKLLDLRQGPCRKNLFSKCINCPLGRQECRLSRHAYPYAKGACKCTHPYRHEGYIVRKGYCLHCVQTGAAVFNEKHQRR